MSKKIELLEVDISTESFLKKGAQAQKELERLKDESNFFKKAIKEGKKTIEEYNSKLAELEKQGKKNSTEYKNLDKNAKTFSKNQEKNRQKLELVTNSLSKQKQEHRNNQRSITDFNKAVESELGIITKTDGSINQLNRALANNRKIYRNLTEEQRENAAVGGELFKTISQQDAKYKDLQSSIGTTQVRVGDYKQQIKEALKESSGFSQQLDTQISQIPIVGTKLGGVVKVTRNYASAKLASAQATNTGTKSLKAFRLALISTGIGAILVALGSLIAYFSSTQKGIDKVNRVLTPLKVVFQSLWGLVQSLGSALVDAFISPKKAMVSIYNFLKNQIINRFKAFAVILDGIRNWDFKKAGNGLLQLGTGVEDVIGKTAKLAKDTGNFFDEAWKRGKKIEELQQKLNKGEADYVLNLAKAKEEFKKQNKIAEDQTKSIEVREAAAKRSIQIQKDINKLEDDRLSTEIEIMKLKQQSNDTSDAEKTELAQLEAKRNESRTRQFEAETTQQNKLNGIRKQAVTNAIALAKKRTDAALKESKTAIDIYIAEQAVKAKTLQEELIVAENVSKKKKEILKAELKAGKISQAEYNLAILQLDNDLISKRAEIAVDVANRELQIFKDAHQQKLDANTFFTEELLNQEVARLDAIANKELEYQKKRLEQGVINQQEYNDAINTVNEENRIKKEEAQQLRDEAEKEKRIIDLENQRLIDEERFNNSFQVQLSRLKQRYDAELKSAKKTGADTNIITHKYEIQKAKIQDAQRQTKLNADGQAFGKVADFIGKEHGLGKAAALAQAGINIQQGITKALASKGFAGIAEGILIAARGGVAVGKIANSTVPKAEKGAVFTIGGNRHSSGGTQFYGEDGTHFEAEKDEKMFILNRQASAALGPLLSDINQQYGGVSLSHASSYLNDGGQVLRGTSQNIKVDTGKGIDYDLLALKIGEANRQLPPPVVAVEDINTGQGNYADVVNGANLGG